MAALWRGQQLTEQAHRGRAGNRRNGRVHSSRRPVADGVNMQMATGSVGLLAERTWRVLMEDRMEHPPENRCGHVQQDAASRGQFVERWRHSGNVILRCVLTWLLPRVFFSIATNQKHGKTFLVATPGTGDTSIGLIRSDSREE